MKEVTEWNGKPRWMWVWDENENAKTKKYVFCFLTEEEMKECDTSYPVRTKINCYKHCAEIEEKKRPCTREELIEMLKKQGLPMLRIVTDGCEDVGVTSYIVESISDDNVHISGNYSYEELCREYTLLDGTELWVEE